jgi:hypothetical protein
LQLLLLLMQLLLLRYNTQARDQARGAPRRERQHRGEAVGRWGRGCGRGMRRAEARARLGAVHRGCGSWRPERCALAPAAAAGPARQARGFKPSNSTGHHTLVS